MSTKAMRYLIQLVRTGHAPTDISLDAAEREIERIEKAAKTTVASVRLAATPKGAAAQALWESVARDAP